MPRRDGTGSKTQGPTGRGPNTGRGAGPCSGTNTGVGNQNSPVNPGQSNTGQQRPQGNRKGTNSSNGRGRGHGNGRGKGSGRGRGRNR